MPTPPLPKHRLEGITDGIFAVAMTLLVIELKFPEPVAGRTLFADLGALVDRVDNYVITFVALAVFWLGHLRIMRRLREPDIRFVVLNLAFVFLITLLPPLTALLGDHPSLPRAAVLYGGNLVLLLVLETMMWRQVCGSLANDTLRDPTAAWRRMRRHYAATIAVVVVGIGVALAEIEIGASVGLAPWFYFVLIGAAVARPPLEAAAPA